MICPKCKKGKALIINTRQDKHTPNAIYRRRKCPDCDFRWSTIEVPMEGWNKAKRNAERLRKIFDAFKVE